MHCGWIFLQCSAVSEWKFLTISPSSDRYSDILGQFSFSSSIFRFVLSKIQAYLMNRCDPAESSAVPPFTICFPSICWLVVAPSDDDIWIRKSIKKTMDKKLKRNRKNQAKNLKQRQCMKQARNKWSASLLEAELPHQFLFDFSRIFRSRIY